MCRCRSVQIAACIVHIFIQCVELTYVNDLCIALIFVVHLNIERVFVPALGQKLGLNRGVGVQHGLVQVALLAVVRKSALARHVLLLAKI